MISQTAETGQLGMRPQVSQAMNELRSFLFARVYKNPVAKGEESRGMDILKRLYEHYFRNPDDMPQEFCDIAQRDGLSRAVCDYIAGMTDRFAVAKFEDLFIPKFWSKI